MNELTLEERKKAIMEKKYEFGLTHTQLDELLTEYLSQYHAKGKLAVYKSRWWDYIRKKKQPHYDALKYYHIYKLYSDERNTIINEIDSRIREVKLG